MTESNEIPRHAAAAPRTVSEYFERDHRRLDAVLLQVGQLVCDGAFADAAKRFAEVQCALSRHIDVEEPVLFWETLPARPTAAMQAEHVEIRRLTDAVAVAIEGRDAESCARSLGLLADMLLMHNIKEERVLYPMAEEAAGWRGRRAELLRRAQAF